MFALQWTALLLGAVIGALSVKLYLLTRELNTWKKLYEMRTLLDYHQTVNMDFHEDAERTPPWVEKETNGTLQ